MKNQVNKAQNPSGVAELSPRPAQENCFHCKQDLVAHHHRNLKCPVGETVYRRDGGNMPSVEHDDDALERITRDRDYFDRELTRCGKIAQELRAELKATQGSLNVRTAFWESAEKEIEQLRKALIWCSGSGDFAPEGQAREGWLKLCAPLLNAPEPEAEITR